MGKSLSMLMFSTPSFGTVKSNLWLSVLDGCGCRVKQHMTLSEARYVSRLQSGRKHKRDRLMNYDLRHSDAHDM